MFKCFITFVIKHISPLSVDIMFYFSFAGSSVCINCKLSLFNTAPMLDASGNYYPDPPDTLKVEENEAYA